MKPNERASIQAIFAKIKLRFDEQNDDSLICKQGFYKDSVVVKLQRAAWTNDSMERVQNETGIFFSVWINTNGEEQNRVHYNIHALKLRKLNGYAITSRDFATSFRLGFKSMQESWPNVSVDHGPLTLMQGWIVTAPENCESDVLSLLNRFKQICPLIDKLLDARRTGSLMKHRRGSRTA